MRCSKTTPFIIIMLVLISGPISLADEGMWPPDMINRLPFDSLKARGLEITAEQIYNPTGGSLSNAIVVIDGGTGSFLSPDGLIMTNHHVGFNAIQRQSTPEKDYLAKGFYAATLAEELPAIGYDCWMPLSYVDVTKRVLSAVNDKMTGLNRQKAIEKINKKIVAETEKGRDVKCDVPSYFGGQKYMLITYFKIRDVRLVFAPPRSIGDYGGDIDNWMWPRHAGDFSFFRAYVSPDGKSADYDVKNVPYKSKTFLKFSLSGVKENDFQIVMGFPGSTNRYECAFQIDKMINFDYPADIRVRKDLISILESVGALNSADALKLEAPLAGLTNFLKKNEGMMDGFEKSELLANKIARQDSLARFIESDPLMEKKYGKVISSLDSLFQDHKSWQEYEFWLYTLVYQSDFVYLASSIYKWSLEREKRDIDREPGYQDRDSLDREKYLSEAQTNLVPAADKQILIYLFEKILDLPAGQKIAAVENIFPGRTGDRNLMISRFADSLYANTRLGTVEERLRIFGRKKDELLALNDPFINLAAALETDRENLRNRNRAFEGVLSKLMPQLIAALGEWKKGLFYPDANGTMRLSYGVVKGYKPRDAVYYDWFTTLHGVFEKNTGEDPFNVPSELVAAAATRDYGPYFSPVLGDVPVAFLSDHDLTNGSSGSPVLNGKGEIVGISFDGNYESMTSDYQFDPAITRNISADARYILYLLDKVYHAHRVMKEITIE